MTTDCWFAGLTTMDVVHRTTRRPDANEKVTATTQHIAAGGPAANAAVTAAAMGTTTPLLITALGDSPAGELARRDLTAHGVRVLDSAPGHELAVSAVLVDAATGERSVVSTDAGATRVAVPDLRGESDPVVVLLDGHHPELMRGVLDQARARGALVVLDAGRWRPIFTDLIPRADIVACSADFRLPGGGSGLHTIRAFGAGAVVITDGARPVLWADDQGSGSIAVPRVPVRDTLGAGDAFHGALVAALASGAGLPDSVETAVTAASLRVQHIGPRSFLAAVHERFGAAR